MKEYLRLIDTNTGGPRYDVTPLFTDAEALQQLVRDLLQPFEADSFDYVAGIDALGFILGAAMALHARKGFIPIRKGGKLPGATRQIELVDYTRQKKTLEIRADALAGGGRVLLVDEWIETGAQITAAIQLLEGQGATIIGIATINLDDSPQAEWLRHRYPCHSLGLEED